MKTELDACFKGSSYRQHMNLEWNDSYQWYRKCNGTLVFCF